MHSKWSSHFINPSTSNRLTLSTDARAQEELEEGYLLDTETSDRFPIINGIPRFTSFQLPSQTTDSFGRKWNDPLFWAPEIHSEGLKKTLTEQLCSLLGCTSEEELHKVLSSGERYLNAGCGYAWTEELFNFNLEIERFAVDISESVLAAKHRTKHLPNVCIAQADILNLPFSDSYFDIVFSNGVVHHTPDPKSAVLHLCQKLKSGGLIGLYIYCVKPFFRELADRELRKLTTKMTYDACYAFSESMTALGHSFKEIGGKITIRQDIPVLNIKKGIYDLQSFIYDHFVKCFYNPGFEEKVCHLTNLDWYHPEYASHHTRDEIEMWLKQGGIASPKFIQPQGWEHSGYFVSGRKS